MVGKSQLPNYVFQVPSYSIYQSNTYIHQPVVGTQPSNTSKQNSWQVYRRCQTTSNNTYLPIVSINQMPTSKQYQSIIGLLQLPSHLSIKTYSCQVSRRYLTTSYRYLPIVSNDQIPTWKQYLSRYCCAKTKAYCCSKKAIRGPNQI